MKENKRASFRQGRLPDSAAGESEQCVDPQATQANCGSTTERSRRNDPSLLQNTEPANKVIRLQVNRKPMKHHLNTYHLEKVRGRKRMKGAHMYISHFAYMNIWMLMDLQLMLPSLSLSLSLFSSFSLSFSLSSPPPPPPPLFPCPNMLPSVV